MVHVALFVTERAGDMGVKKSERARAEEERFRWEQFEIFKFSRHTQWQDRPIRSMICLSVCLVDLSRRFVSPVLLYNIVDSRLSVCLVDLSRRFVSPVLLYNIVD
jgi:hypothetical protein